MELLLTSISWVLITSVVSNWSYFDYVNYLTFLTTSSQLQKQKTINVSTQIQNYFLTSFSWAVVTFVVSNWSHSDYLNLPVTFDNKLLATKKERPELFLHIIANKYGITYLPQLHWSSSNFLSIKITAFWLPMALDNKQAALRIPPKTAKFWNYVWKRVFNAIVNCNWKADEIRRCMFKMEGKRRQKGEW